MIFQYYTIPDFKPSFETNKFAVLKVRGFKPFFETNKRLSSFQKTGASSLIDFDGSFTYSNIIQIDFSTTEKDRAIFFPNPVFDSTLKLELNTEGAELITIKIIDGLARKWANIILYSDGNRLQLPIDISMFTGGIYFANIKMGNRRLNRSFVVVRD